MKRFEDFFRELKIVIVSWYENVESGVISFGNVVIGARSKQELEDYVIVVKELASEIHS